MKIAVLGGAFNPPHLIHQLMAGQTLEFTKVDEVWLAPCFKHTFDKRLAKVEDRTLMTKMLVNSKIKYCHEEIKNKLSGDSIELMKILKAKYSQHQFSFLIGSDNLAFFKKWGSWQKLATNFTIYVFPRPGFDFNLKKYCLDNYDFKFKLISNPLLTTSNLSSTIIRNRIKKGLEIKHLVPKQVKDYIEKHKLYA